VNFSSNESFFKWPKKGARRHHQRGKVRPWLGRKAPLGRSRGMGGQEPRIKISLLNSSFFYSFFYLNFRQKGLPPHFPISSQRSKSFRLFLFFRSKNSLFFPTIHRTFVVLSPSKNLPFFNHSKTHVPHFQISFVFLSHFLFFLLHHISPKKSFPECFSSPFRICPSKTPLLYLYCRPERI